MSLPVFAVAVLVVVYFVRWYLDRRTRVSHWNKLPTLQPRFFLGNIKEIIDIYKRKSKYHAGVYILERVVGSNLLFQKEGLQAFWIGPTPIVPVFCPEFTEIILSSNVHLEKSSEYRFLHQWLGFGLLTSKGQKWRNRRKLLTPCFHFRILEDFLPTFNEQSLILVEKIAKASQVGDYINVTPLVTLCTLDIVCETVMGAHIGAQSGQNLDYTTAVHNLGDFFNQRNIQPWLFTDFLFNLTEMGRGFNRDLKTIHTFTEKVIKEKKEAVLSQKVEKGSKTVSGDEFSGKKRQALMDLLLDQFFNGQQLTEEDIKEEVETFMFAGHDTTASAVAFVLYCVGLYPEVQRRIEEELDSIFQGDHERDIEMDDVRNMKYMECTLKETQRIFPSVPVIGRTIAEDIKLNGYVIPKGTDVHCNIISLHRRVDSFPNPEVFDPDRFLPENVQKRHPYSFIPFSAGPRNCIGQKFAGLEAKVILCNILRRFRIVSLDPRDKVHVKMEFTLKPAEPIRLKFLPRR